MQKKYEYQFSDLKGKHPRARLPVRQLLQSPFDVDHTEVQKCKKKYEYQFSDRNVWMGLLQGRNRKRKAFMQRPAYSRSAKWLAQVTPCCSFCDSDSECGYVCWPWKQS